MVFVLVCIYLLHTHTLWNDPGLLYAHSLISVGVRNSRLIGTHCLQCGLCSGPPLMSNDTHRRSLLNLKRTYRQRNLYTIGVTLNGTQTDLSPTPQVIDLVISGLLSTPSI